MITLSLSDLHADLQSRGGAHFPTAYKSSFSLQNRPNAHGSSVTSQNSMQSRSNQYQKYTSRINVGPLQVDNLVGISAIDLFLV
jgi:hypothetical protein